MSLLLLLFVLFDARDQSSPFQRNPNAAASAITKEALTKHDAQMVLQEQDEIPQADSSEDPFAQIRRLYSSPAESHREVLHYIFLTVFIDTNATGLRRFVCHHRGT